MGVPGSPTKKALARNRWLERGGYSWDLRPAMLNRLEKNPSKVSLCIGAKKWKKAEGDISCPLRYVSTGFEEGGG